MRWFGRNAWGLLALVWVVALGAFVYAWDPLPVQVMRHAVFDQFQRWQPRVYKPAPVRIIDIDEESLQRLGQWPWPRTLMAELTKRLQAAQPAAIAFDVLFSEPDRTSPEAMAALWGARSSVRQALQALPDHDTELARAIGAGKVVLGFALGQLLVGSSTPEPGDAGTGPPKNLSKTSFVAIGQSALGAVHGFAEPVAALELLQSKADGGGALAFVPDSDGVIRRVPLLVRYGNQLLPTLSAEALRVAQGAQNIVTRSTPAPHGTLQEVRIGQVAIPTSPKGEVWLHYTGPVSERYIPAWQVLAGAVQKDALRGNILLVGASAQGLMDLRFSPLGRMLPGVEIHAQLLEQVLTGGGLQRPAWSRGAEPITLTVGGLLVGVVALTSPALLSLAATAVMLAAIWAGAWWGFSAHGLLLDPVMVSLVLALSFVMASLVHHFASERRQAWIRQAFSRYVSPNLVAHLIDHPGALELGGKRQWCSFVFTDLAGFTALMEQMDPADAVNLLNVYLDRMIAIAFTHQGTLDRVVGDAVAIMFSAPLPQADHQHRALACALEMQQFAGGYEADLNARDVAFCATRIGVHSGEVIVGNFGGAAIFDYRALGDPVNTASRLEAANKHLGTLVCVSEATLAGCPGAVARPVGRLRLAGKSQPLMVFEPQPLAPSVPTSPDQSTSHWPAYANAYELMRLENPEALAAFAKLHQTCPQDALVKMHLDRLTAGAVGDLIVMAQK